MLKPSTSNEERVVPYITELLDLLNKDTFTELNTDDETLDKLKTHFITQYAKLESVCLKETDELQNFYLVNYIESRSKNEKVWKKVQR